jgi:hypothetical protein
VVWYQYIPNAHRSGILHSLEKYYYEVGEYIHTTVHVVIVNNNHGS